MFEPASRGTDSVESETTLNGRQRKRGCVAAPGLPDDLVLWEIFYRLAAKEILRCRAACRSWRRLTCDEEFLLAHHHRQPSLPLVSFRCHDGCKTNSDASVEAFDLRRTPAVSRPILGFNDYNGRRNFSLHGSCDGLLLLYLSNNRFYLCNPATRQWLGLPALTGANVAALYRDRPSGEYRILYWDTERPNKSSSSSVAYRVMSVGSLEEPRYIGLPVASTSMKKKIGDWFICACEEPPALLHDCLHWYASRCPIGKVVVFDTLVESFRGMISPIANIPVATNSVRLLQMDGTIGIGYTHVDGDTMIAEVWVLQDYKMELWSLKYKIELPLAVMTEPRSGYKFCGQVVSENRDMLVILRDESYYPWSFLFLHCDSKGKLLEKFHRLRVDPVVLGIYFKESLVRHVFFQRKKSGHVRVPRFFRGL